MTPNEDVSKFDDEGYLVVRNVLNSEQVHELRKLCSAELKRENTKLIADTMLKHQKILEAVETPKLLGALKKILGNPIVALPLSSVMHNGFGTFHSDTTATELRGWSYHKETDFRIVVLAIYLQDNDDFGGGIRLVPGSHKKPDMFIDLFRKKHATRAELAASPIKRLIKRLSRGRIYSTTADSFKDLPGQIDVNTKAGDVVFWDMRMAHRASPAQRAGSIPDGKIAIFYELGSNNHPTQERARFLTEIGEVAKHRAKEFVPPPPTADFIFK